MASLLGECFRIELLSETDLRRKCRLWLRVPPNAFRPRRCPAGGALVVQESPHRFVEVTQKAGPNGLTLPQVRSESGRAAPPCNQAQPRARPSSLDSPCECERVACGPVRSQIRWLFPRIDAPQRFSRCVPEFASVFPQRSIGRVTPETQSSLLQSPPQHSPESLGDRKRWFRKLRPQSWERVDPC